MNAQTLDIRPLPIAARRPETFHVFDSLPPGDRFVLIDDEYPKSLLYQLQIDRPGSFDWSVLERGPEAYRIEIRRRETQGLRWVAEHLGSDHRRLDELAGEVSRLIGEGSFLEASKRFNEFVCGLEIHIIAEEQLLFPAFEQATGIVAGPTQVMRIEHTEIRRLMAATAAAVRDENGAGAKEMLAALEGLLGEHNVKEERILYPMVDRILSERERDDLVKKMQAV